MHPFVKVPIPGTGTFRKVNMSSIVRYGKSDGTKS